MLTFKIEWYKGMAPVLSTAHNEIPIVILPLELMFRKFQISGIIISIHFPSLVYLHLHWHCNENESQPLKIESKNLFWFYVCFSGTYGAIPQFFKRTFIKNKFWKSLVDFRVFYSNKVFALKLSWCICCIDYRWYDALCDRLKYWIKTI